MGVKHVSNAYERFSALMRLSDKMLARAEREDLEECTKVLAVQCAHYRAKFGEVPMTETMEVLNSETMNDEQAKWIADGFEMIVGILATLKTVHRSH